MTPMVVCGRQGDPGYQETAKMLVEGALCLILDFHRLPKGTVTG